MTADMTADITAKVSAANKPTANEGTSKSKPTNGRSVNPGKSQRDPTTELLRIIAMLMIVCLHYLDKGSILPDPMGEMRAAGHMAWVLEAFCVSSVNVYVLISSYYMADRDYDPRRALRLWSKVLLISVVIAAIAFAGGVGFDLYTGLHFIFPVITEHYWFVTAYMIMILTAPLMNRGLKKLPEKTLRYCVLTLLVLFSLSKSILPVTLATDHKGYDALWFIVLYIIGAYIRWHGRDVTAKLSAAIYIISSVMIYISLILVRSFYQMTGSLGDFIRREYNYNSLLCLAASVGLFLLFVNVRIPEGKITDAIRSLGSCSLYVYLVHEHELVRYRWPQWLGVSNYSDTVAFIPHMLVTALFIYLIGYGVGMVTERFMRRKNAEN